MKSAAALALTLFLATLTACDTTKRTGTASPDPQAPNEYPMIQVEQPLNRWVRAQQPVATAENGIMKVAVPIRLLSDQGEYSNIQYRFQFFDSAGMPLRNQTGWQYTVLEPRVEKRLTGAALDNNAAAWRLEVRSAR